MTPIRVLVVDDSAVVRRIVGDEIEADPQLTLAGIASNGVIALVKIESQHPDVVVMDVEMPEMDGLTTLAAIRNKWPKLPVIMFSSLTERAAEATLKALALGAADYATKPRTGGLEAAREAVRSDVLAKIKGVCAKRVPTASPTAEGPPAVVALDRGGPSASLRVRQGIDVVAIGASTGGPAALTEVLAAIPFDLPVPVVIAQHMPPVFTQLFAKQLTSHGHIPVREAGSGETLGPGEAWLAPGDFHLEVVREGCACRTLLHRGPQENSCRPAVDALFRSVASAFGSRVLAVVLTGMGRDGAEGARLVREAGGRVVAQDEASSVVWGMPGAVVRGGLAHAVLPLGGIADEIRRTARIGRRGGAAHVG